MTTNHWFCIRYKIFHFACMRKQNILVERKNNTVAWRMCVWDVSHRPRGQEEILKECSLAWLCRIAKPKKLTGCWYILRNTAATGLTGSLRPQSLNGHPWYPQFTLQGWGVQQQEDQGREFSPDWWTSRWWHETREGSSVTASASYPPGRSGVKANSMRGWTQKSDKRAKHLFSCQLLFPLYIQSLIIRVNNITVYWIAADIQLFSYFQAVTKHLFVPIKHSEQLM